METVIWALAGAVVGIAASIPIGIGFGHLIKRGRQR